MNVKAIVSDVISLAIRLIAAPLHMTVVLHLNRVMRFCFSITYMLTYFVFLTFIFVKISDTNADLDESVGAALNDHQQHLTLPKKQKL